LVTPRKGRSFGGEAYSIDWGPELATLDAGVPPDVLEDVDESERGRDPGFFRAAEVTGLLETESLETG